MYPLNIPDDIKTEVENLLNGFDVVITKKLNKIRFYFKKNYPTYKVIKVKNFPESYSLEA